MKYGVMTLKLNELSGTTAHLTGLNNINILVGRNGSGKSRFFRDIEARTSQHKKEFYVRYVSPERAGSFKRDGQILTNMSDSPEWLSADACSQSSQGFQISIGVALSRD